MDQNLVVPHRPSLLCGCPACIAAYFGNPVATVSSAELVIAAPVAAPRPESATVPVSAEAAPTATSASPLTAKTAATTQAAAPAFSPAPTASASGFYLTAINQTISQPEQTIAVSSLFSVVDTTGTISSYRFDNVGSVKGGYFMLGSQFYFATSVLTITPAQLSTFTYVTPIYGYDTISVTATNQGGGSAGTTITVTGPAPPAITVTGASAAIAFGVDKSIALGPLINATDNDGVHFAFLTYTVTVLSGSGVLVVDGFALGTKVENLNALGIEETSFARTGVSGTAVISITVQDEIGATGSTTLTLTSAAPARPALSLTSVAPTNTGVPFNFSALIRASDSNGIATSDLTYTLSYTGSGASLELGGSAIPVGTSTSLTAADLSSITVASGLYGGQLQVTLTAADGYATSTPFTFTLTVPSGQGPIVNAPEGTAIAAARGQDFNVSNLVVGQSEYPNATVAEYEFYLSDAGGGIASLSIGSSVQRNDMPVYVDVGQLSSVSYFAGTGKDILYVRANDGTDAKPHWGAWETLTITAPPDSGPALTAQTLTIDQTETVSGSNLVLNPPSDATNYQFFEPLQYRGGDPAGTLLNNGSPSGYFQVAANALSSVTFTPTSNNAADKAIIWVRASDGIVWGNWVIDTVTITDTARPTVTAQSNGLMTATHGEAFGTSDLFAYNSPAGPAITQFELYLADATGGIASLSVRGSVKPNDTPVYVDAGSLASVSYVAEAGKDILYVRANNGTSTNPHWGAWSTITITAPAEVPPVLAAMTVSVGFAGTLGSSSLVSMTSDTYAITQYQFYDRAQYLSTDTAGSLYNDGSASGYITVNAAELSHVTFLANSASATTSIYVRVSDGAAWSNWVIDTVTVASAPGPMITPISPNGYVAATAGASYSASDLFSENDPTNGTTVSQYEFYVKSGPGAKGTLSFSGAAQTNNTAVFSNTLSGVRYQIQSGTQSLYVRANDGGTSTNPHWGAWSLITVVAPAVTASPVTPASPPALSISSIVPPLSSAMNSVVSPAALLATDRPQSDVLLALHHA